jgi:hypothetical protein
VTEKVVINGDETRVAEKVVLMGMKRVWLRKLF